MAATKSAAVYLRVSTDRQTIENQRIDLERLVQARGFDAVLYEETERAAKVRAVLDRLLADARAGRVHAVAVWALDRLHRSMVGAIQTGAGPAGRPGHQRPRELAPRRHLRLGG